MTPRSSVVTVLFILLTTVSSRALQSGPTAEECRDHIEAAIKEFIDGQSESTDGDTASEAYTRAQLEDAYSEADGGGGDEDSIQGDRRVTEDDDDEDLTEITESTENDQDDDSETSDDKRQERSATENNDNEDPETEEKQASETAGEDDDEDDDDESHEKRVPEDAEDDDETNEDVKREVKDNDDDEEKDEASDVTTEEPEDQLEAPPTLKEQFQSASESEEDEPSGPQDEGLEEDEEESEKGEDRIERDTEEGESAENESHTDDAEGENEPETQEDDGSSDEVNATSTYSKHEPSTEDEPASEANNADETDEKPDDETAEDQEQTEDKEHDTAEEEEEEEVIVAGPGELRTRENIETILGLGEESETENKQREKIGNDVLKEIKRLYEGGVRPLEQLYKFKDISTRQMGDPEIFSKPMVLFMGPWSTGKSAIINYLLGTEYTRYALKTGAEPTSHGFTVITYGDSSQVIDGTQLAADWAFSTLQKFGQTFLDHLRGRKIPNPLLQKMTIVDTPGILENRKSTERQYPFNDAFQWFIDRADLIYIVFDPTKLDIGLELEALFDQLKGRENQVRILLNKADTVKPQELMKVQGTLLWNLSPLLGTSEAPTVFVGSLWSRPYLPGSPMTLLDAQEEAFLEDIHEALEHRIENKIGQARRHAVRVRNHAKMVDCYLSTYYNHKTFFSNKRKVADDIIDNPQNYHIYEGLSIMTNVSRYDLPDPEIYREFFRIHPLFDFKPLASTCSYFKGCPLDKLDIAIAYDLPELVGKYHRMIGNQPVIGGR